MAKKYIVKQTVDYMGRGEKTATFTVPCENDTQLAILIAELEGKIEVYEQNLTLSVNVQSTNTTSFVTADSIKMRLKGAETKYISAYNRPIIFKSSTNLPGLATTMKMMFKPFDDTFANENPQDVSIDLGDLRKLQ